MCKKSNRIFASMVFILLLAAGLVTTAAAQDPNTTIVGPSTHFTPGNLVVSVEGCGVYQGTCTGIPNGTGNGTGNSSVGGYGDNQASLFTLFQYAPSGTSSAAYVNSLFFPQAGSGANLPVSAEYGSSSEGSVQLSGTGQYLTIMGYGVNANAFNADPTLYGNSGGELAQSGSLTGQGYTPIPRVVTTIDPYGNINSSTASYNVFNTNNPRSTYSADGINFYISGQGTGCDLTGGVFLTTLGAVNDAPTAIIGGDAVPTASCVTSGYTGPLVAQDTRTVQIYSNTLYISMDSTEGKSDNRSLIGTLGTPPATSIFVPNNPPTGDTGGPNLLNGFGNAGGTGRVKLTAAETNGINVSGEYINVSPDNYFFASPTVLYVADSGSPKNTSADNETTYSLCGAGGLQKWVNESGTWTWVYTLSQGLNLVANPNSKSGDTTCSSNTAGTTGLLGLTGVVSGANVRLYATNYTIGDLDPTYLYGITDVLSATTKPNTSFTLLATAPQDSNFKGVSFAPSLPAGSATITSSPSGLTVSTSGTGCEVGTYVAPVTLTWAPGNPCQLSVVSPQTVAGTEYVFSKWQDGTTATTDSVTAPTTSAVYTASFLIAQAIGFTAASPVTYGVPPITLSATGGASGNPVTFSIVSGPGSLSGSNNSVLTVTGAGTIVVAANQSGNSTYAAATQVEQSIVVNPATLTVTANNASMALGAALPAFTASYSGFVNGDGVGVLSGYPSLTTTATSSSPAGTYPIVAAQGTLSAANYTFAFVNGTLSIVAAPTVVITTSATLSGSHGAGYTASITVTNSGTGAASNVVLTSATLGATTGTPLPQNLGAIAAGGSSTFTVSFPGSAGLDGAGVSEKYSGTYTGGSFSASVRSVTLP